MPRVVTANTLRSGAVVYLAAGGRWVGDLAEAAVAHDPADLRQFETEALAAVTANEVTAVYAMEVALIDGRPMPLSVREQIRATLSTAN